MLFNITVVRASNFTLMNFWFGSGGGCVSMGFFFLRAMSIGFKGSHEVHSVASTVTVAVSCSGQPWPDPRNCIRCRSWTSVSSCQRNDDHSC